MGYLIQTFDLPPFIVTLAGLYLARGLYYLVSLFTIGITNNFWQVMAHGQVKVIAGSFVSPSVIIAIVMLLAGMFISRSTKFGRTVYAIGGNEQSGHIDGPSRRPYEDPALRLQRLLRGAGRSSSLFTPFRDMPSMARAWSWTRSHAS